MTDHADAAARIAIEICVDSAAGVTAAIAGGADRIELCAALAIGGLTPGAGLVAMACEAAARAGIGVFGMIRSRAGGFHHDADDLRVAIDDAKALLDLGVDGLVFGATRNGRVDVASCEAWMGAVSDAAWRPLSCTFHRAIDVVDDPVAAVDTVAALGFERILTSGGRSRAIDGAATIAAMVAQAAGRVTIVAGSGVVPGNVASLVATTGVREVHASAGRAPDAVDARLVELGFASAAARITDVASVSALRSALDNRSRIGH